jgi:GNAT superfamily N-acetyltransferase
MNRPGREITTSYLEMFSVKELSPRESRDPDFWIREATTPQWQFNRFLYQFVGERWNWTDKLVWSDEQWRRYVEDPSLRTFGAYYGGAPAGYYELHRTETEGTEIAYFGLAPAFCGRGLGGVLLTSALREAWAAEPRRVWVHTCTDDHPAALANYQARGMRLYKTETHFAAPKSGNT